jgi:hypothetical protein
MKWDGEVACPSVLNCPDGGLEIQWNEEFDVCLMHKEAFVSLVLELSNYRKDSSLRRKPGFLGVLNASECVRKTVSMVIPGDNIVYPEVLSGLEEKLRRRLYDECAHWGLSVVTVPKFVCTRPEHPMDNWALELSALTIAAFVEELADVEPQL